MSAKAAKRSKSRKECYRLSVLLLGMALWAQDEMKRLFGPDKETR